MIGDFVLILSFALAIFGMVRYKRLTMPFKLLSIYLIYSFLMNALNIYINDKYKNNASLVHISTITNYLFYSSIYYYFFKNKYIKKAIIVSIILIIVFFLINALFIQPFNKVFPSNVILTTEILYVLLALLLFKQMLLYTEQINIIKQSVFWYNTAILFFSTTMFLNFALINYYGQHHLYNMIVYYFWYSIDIIFNILLGVSILTDKKEVIATNAK